MPILVATNLLPGAKRSGGEIVTQSVVDALAGGDRDVRVMGWRSPDDTGPDAPGELCVGRRPIETRAAGLSAVGWMLRAVATNRPYTGVKWASRGYRRAVADGLAERPEAMVVDHAGLLAVIPPPSRLDTPLVHLSHNAEARMYERLARASRGRAARLAYARESRAIRGYETELARHARQVWALTRDDAEYFRSLHPGVDARTLDVASALPEPPPPAEPECDVAIIGTWSWQANEHGLRWFADKVLPHLNGLRVEVAGRGADWLDGRSTKVWVRGPVPDAGEFMRRARVVAVPSIEGGGVQLKTLDGIASGVPLVSTTVGTRGIDDLPSSVAVADDPEEFARQLERLAREADRTALRDEAIAWSRARRERLARNVTEWVAELA